MPQSEAQKRATLKHHEKLDEIKIWIPKNGKKDLYRTQAEKQGMSLNAYIIQLIENDIAASRDE